MAKIAKTHEGKFLPKILNRLYFRSRLTSFYVVNVVLGIAVFGGCTNKLIVDVKRDKQQAIVRHNADVLDNGAGC